jgi:hypothetical protein
MASTVLHVVFNISAAETVQVAMQRLGLNDEVVALSDSLSFGPINPPDPDLRAGWVESELGIDGWQEVTGEAADLWAAALRDGQRRIVWLSRRSTQEYCGFLEFVWRLGDRQCDFIDVTDVPVGSRRGSYEEASRHTTGSLGSFSVDDILGANPRALATPLTQAMRDKYRAAWAILRTENAPFRVLTTTLELRSAEISHFDSQLLGFVREEWTKAALVVGCVLGAFSEAGLYQTGDWELAARLRTMIESGRIEGRGDLYHVQRSEVRLPLRS